jgi:hypothetical protein
MINALGACATLVYRQRHTPPGISFTVMYLVLPHVLGVKHAHPQHLKVFRYFVYIQYGFGMQFLGVCSFNHDTAASYRLGHTPPFPLKLTHTSTCNTA